MGKSIKEVLDLVSKDARRYRWLRAQYALGKETYLAKGIVSEDQLDEHIDKKELEESNAIL